MIEGTNEVKLYGIIITCPTMRHDFKINQYTLEKYNLNGEDVVEVVFVCDLCGKNHFVRL